MSIKHLLEDFSVPSRPTAQAQAREKSDVEERVLESFDRGYKAGWEDSSAAHSKEVAHIRSELARNLQDMSFTFTEARTQLLEALEPLVRELTDSVLPKLATASLGAHVLEELLTMADGVTDAAFEISLHPNDREAVKTALGEDHEPRTRLSEDPDLVPGQVRLRVGEAERQIDSGALLASVSAATAEFFDHAKEDQRNVA
ncbi:MAG: FliH/SctL family protein [Pseudomonadota bacterium]